ncbi:MAG: ATPase [Lysobacteraceae bacterium]|nr:MAG: ATPase [Xanthomonadaceae bacterium]
MANLASYYRFSRHEALFWWVVWTVVGLVLVRIEAADATRAGFAGASWEPWVWAFSASYGYALVAPAIVYFCHQWPLDRARLWQTAPRLLLLYAPTAIVFTSLMLGLRHLVYWLATGDGYPIDSLVDRYIYEFPKSVLLFFLVVFVTYTRLYQQQAAQQKLNAAQLNEALSEARLRALQEQLQPHFLFNTLNLISSKMYQSQSVADSIITHLADLLRYSLKTREQSTVTLEQELDAARSFLSIAQLRFEDRLNFELDVAPRTLPIPVPPLLLQPLLENAVKHGIEPNRSGGNIFLLCELEDAHLRLLVRNSLAARQSSKESFGIGLANTRQRLQVLYGDCAAVTLETVGGDMVTTVRLPVKEVKLERQASSPGG